jgi:hypothetical protein
LVLIKLSSWSLVEELSKRGDQKNSKDETRTEEK